MPQQQGAGQCAGADSGWRAMEPMPRTSARACGGPAAGIVDVEFAREAAAALGQRSAPAATARGQNAEHVAGLKVHGA